MQGAGGVGGLLSMVSGTDAYTYLYDGNGNVGQMLNSSTGTIEAHYEYDPYGNSVLESGALASSNPYRFSTKYLDDEFNLYYYGYRYYDPEIGRWLNKDPLGERGGTNLYSFVLNNPLNDIDPYGLEGLPEWVKDWVYRQYSPIPPEIINRILQDKSVRCYRPHSDRNGSRIKHV